MRVFFALALVASTLVGAAALGAAPSRALADDAAESRFFDRVGRRAFAARRYERALESFLRAQRAAPSPRGLFNVAICARLAHRDVLAFSSFEELLARSDLDPSLRAEATPQRDALASTLALVEVQSSPPGATIYVDRRDLGSYGTTPATLALPAGAHRIELVLDRHEDATLSVEAVVGERREAAGTLAPEQGRLRIEVTPPGARVIARRVDSAPGAPEVPIAPGAGALLPVGRYEVSASATGFVSASATVVVVEGGEESRVLTLDPVPTPRGRVLVSTGGVAARVRIDGVEVAETPARVDGVEVGAHHVELVADGWLDWTGEITVDERRTTFLSVTLVRAR